MQGMYFRFFFCPKQSQGFKPSEAQLYPNTGQVPPGVLANFITCCPLKYHVKIAFIPSILKRVQRWRYPRQYRE